MKIEKGKIYIQQDGKDIFQALEDYNEVDDDTNMVVKVIRYEGDPYYNGKRSDDWGWFSDCKEYPVANTPLWKLLNGIN